MATPPAAPSAAASAPSSGPGTAPRPRTPRVVGVDTARGLAILGMFVAHLGLERHTGFLTPTGWFWLADGRPSALFATLAGTGLAFMTKKAYATGDAAELAVQRVRLLKRSAILLVLGWVLTALGTPVAVILGAYAVLFVLAMPFLRMRPAALLLSAGVVALVMPSLVLLSRYALLGATSPHAYAWEPAGQVAIVLPVIADLWSGYYPALSWLLYVLVGLAVGRMAMQRWQTQLALLLGGAAVAAVAYLSGAALERSTTGLVQDLVTIEPHADTTFEMVGNVGFAVAVLGLCLLLTTAVAPLRVLLTPVSAMGAMSLTVYSAHIVYIAVLGTDAVWNPVSNQPLIWLVVGSMVLATVWQVTLGQGPMERLIHRMIRPPAPPAPPAQQTWPPAQPWPAQPGYQGPQPPAGTPYQPTPGYPVQQHPVGSPPAQAGQPVPPGWPGAGQQPGPAAPPRQTPPAPAYPPSPPPR